MSSPATMRLMGLLVIVGMVLLTGPRAVNAGRTERPLVPPREIPAGRAAIPLLRTWLAEGTDVQAAWAGWVAGERGLKKLGPEVASRLGVEVERGVPACETPLRQVLMDAAIRLGADLPARTLTRILAAGGWTSADIATYLCLRKVGPVHVQVFETLDQEWRIGSRAWFAVAGRLFEHREPAFVLRLLSEWRVKRLLRVWDRNGPYPPWRPFRDSVPGDMRERIPNGYPPIPMRRISLTCFDGYTRLVGGPFPVYGERFVVRGTHLGGGVSGRRPDPDAARHTWLAAYLSAADVPRLEPWAVVDLKWTGGRQPWARKTTAATLDLHSRWRRWRDALWARGLLTRSQREGVSPRIEWVLRDERCLQKRAIPPMPDVPFDARIPAPAPSGAGRRGV